jgi:hypothetical protein
MNDDSIVSLHVDRRRLRERAQSVDDFILAAAGGPENTRFSKEPPWKQRNES